MRGGAVCHMDEPEAVKILKEVVDALAAAHDKGVVRRDIKPDNVMLSGPTSTPWGCWATSC